LKLQFLLAEVILAQDGEAAWDRVRFVLEKQGYLTGDEVRALVAASDSEVHAAHSVIRPAS
jgi:hypothetical protein